MILVTCQSGFESLLARELSAAGLQIAATGPGWVRGEGAAERSLVTATSEPPAVDLSFAHLLLAEVREIQGGSANALAQAAAAQFMQDLRGEKIDAAWPCWWQGPHELVGLNRRVGTVEKAFLELLRARMSRVAKLATPDLPRAWGGARGWFVWMPDFDRAWLARQAWLNGPRRMADDPAAPSRSFLKVEEAYGLLDRPPQAGETVVDLGSAPGGWSYSAARHGARVLALDNGPLKGGALNHPAIEHREVDAFKFRPAPGAPVYDWLFCDLVEDPYRVLEEIVRPWLEQGWCRRFVLNFKFGRTDPLLLRQRLVAPASPLSVHGVDVRIRHLFHDREEFTVTGRRRES